MNKKWKKLACLMFFFLLFAMPCAADDLDTLPVEEAVRAARHVMIGMIGYSEQEADALRYEGYHLEGNITTTVEVYPAQTTDDPFKRIAGDAEQFCCWFATPFGRKQRIPL